MATLIDIGIQDPKLSKVAGMITQVQRRIEATRALYDLLLEYDRNLGPSFYSKNFYTDAEMKELQIFQRRHLLRRIQEEAVKAGFVEFDFKDI